LKLLTEPLSSRHRLAWMVSALALVSCALLGLAARARASETIYWDNYDGHPGTIGFANIDGTGGGELVPTGAEFLSPEGMAFDPVNDRIYVASALTEEIIWVNIHDGTAGALDTTGAPVDDPDGIAVDPTTQMVYWGNSNGSEPIGYAAADESNVRGALDAEGASARNPERIALDTVDGRIYWLSTEGPGEAHVSYVNLNDTGGGELSVPEKELPEDSTGINVDPATQRLYFLADVAGSEPGEFEGSVDWIDLSDVGGGEVDTTNAPLSGPYGLAFDPSSGRFFWGNYGYEPGEAPLGTATLAPGGGGGIAITGTEPAGPQDPIVLKSPTSVAAPQVSASGTSLSCSQGEWSQNYVGSNVYGAPESYGYQWSKNGQPIGGATGTTLSATESGSYTCTVTATNQFGSGSQTSAGYTVTIAVPVAATPASFDLTSASKKKIKVTAGKTAMLSLMLKNAGGTTSSSSKVCVKLTKKAKVGLVAPKCVAVAALAPGASKKVTLKVKTKSGAKGTYKFSVVAGGASGSTTLAEQLTVTAKKHGKKKHGKK
jgi:hypothetical protein